MRSRQRNAMGPGNPASGGGSEDPRSSVNAGRSQRPGRGSAARRQLRSPARRSARRPPAGHGQGSGGRAQGRPGSANRRPCSPGRYPMSGASVPRLMIFVLLATIPAAILRLTQDGPALASAPRGPLGALAGEAPAAQPKPQGRKRATHRMASGPCLTGRAVSALAPRWRPRHRPGSALRRSRAQPF